MVIGHLETYSLAIFYAYKQVELNLFIYNKDSWEYNTLSEFILPRSFFTSSIHPEHCIQLRHEKASISDDKGGRYKWIRLCIQNVISFLVKYKFETFQTRVSSIHLIYIDTYRYHIRLTRVFIKYFYICYFFYLWGESFEKLKLRHTLYWNWYKVTFQIHISDDTKEKS